jgi:CHASE3 domain sensor protein
MRYKALVSRKLDELSNIVLGLSSLLSGNPTREQIENQIEKHKSKLEEIQTLINAEQEA